MGCDRKGGDKSPLVKKGRGAPRSKARLLFAACVVIGAIATVAVWGDSRFNLRPNLRNGQKLQYRSHGRINRGVNTRSNVATMYGPQELKKDISAQLQLKVQEIRLSQKHPMMSAETELSDDEGTKENQAKVGHPMVSFTITGDGSLMRADGLDDLAPEQRLAWQFWLAQFAFGWTLPQAGVKPGEKWKTEEAEKTPTPIANLLWERETTYVQNDKCPVLANERCAVFLTDSTLRQKSNPKDTTPEDYRIRELKTTGFAKGTNERMTYLSLKTGMLIRATEDVKQSMDVTIAKADGSNQVRYEIEVNSHLETVLVP